MWKDIKGFENKYQVNKDGDVISLSRYGTIKDNKYLTKNISRDGYVRYGLFDGRKKKFYFAHRLVAETFIPTNNKELQVNHIDGNKQNNNVKNLEWVTAKENIRHAYRIGLKTPDKTAKNLGKYSQQRRQKSKIKECFTI